MRFDGGCRVPAGLPTARGRAAHRRCPFHPGPRSLGPPIEECSFATDDCRTVARGPSVERGAASVGGFGRRVAADADLEGLDVLERGDLAADGDSFLVGLDDQRRLFEA